jgi:hypothetical protein
MRCRAIDERAGASCGDGVHRRVVESCRTAYALGVALVLGPVAAGGCGARTGLPEPSSNDLALLGFDADGGGASSVCTRCTSEWTCSYCLVQGYAETFRCPPGARPPTPRCWDLWEQYRDEQGRAYTCHYCD